MREMVERTSQRDSRTSLRAPHLPSLSVVLLSNGDRSDLERALAAVAGRCRRMEAEIIVVRDASTDDVDTLGSAYPSVTFLDVAAGTSSAYMREAGMARATGDIVALRLDGAVGDGVWLEAFDATVGCVDEAAPSDLELPMASGIDDAMVQGVDRRRGRAYLTPSVAATPKRRGDLGRVVASATATDAESSGTGVAIDR